MPYNQVFGFGGDLDRNRLEYILKSKGQKSDQVRIVGEHGRKTIPVYPGEEDYSTIAEDTRTFLSKSTQYAGATRNLSTGDLLGKLVNSIVTDSMQIHYVCGFHPEHQMYLTWPFVIGQYGIIKPDQVDLPENATKDLQSLISSRVCLK